MAWTDERVEMLKKLWQEGLSASQIAGRIGGVTRNAVIGKVHRLGLSGRAMPSGTRSTSRPRTVQPRRPRPRPSLPGAAPRAPWHWDRAVQADGHFEPSEELDIPIAERKSILELKEGDCRWPIGDPQAADFHFCGRGKHVGLPYCEFHARKAFQPPQQQRRRDRDEPPMPIVLPAPKVSAA
jgi:GcrA cell cycle regulator